MFENSIYSVISPEGCAAILWKDSSKAAEAARTLGITADRLSALGLVDGVIAEPVGGAHKDHAVAAENMRKALVEHLQPLLKKNLEELVKDRYAKFRKMGEFYEEGKLVTSRVR
jgi:acetyl-CoA carboxylase carboxyl transferase subunit alpha